MSYIAHFTFRLGYLGINSSCPLNWFILLLFFCFCISYVIILSNIISLHFAVDWTRDYFSIGRREGETNDVILWAQPRRHVIILARPVLWSSYCRTGSVSCYSHRHHIYYVYGYSCAWLLEALCAEGEGCFYDEFSCVLLAIFSLVNLSPWLAM